MRCRYLGHRLQQWKSLQDWKGARSISCKALVWFFWSVSKTFPLKNWGVGQKSLLLWLLWRHEKSHILARRAALVLLCLFFSCKVPLLYSLCECPYDRKIKGPLQRNLSFKLLFPKITKVEGKKRAVQVRVHPNLWEHTEWDICRWMEPKRKQSASSPLIKGENEDQGNLPDKDHVGSAVILDF